MHVQVLPLPKMRYEAILQCLLDNDSDNKVLAPASCSLTPLVYSPGTRGFSDGVQLYFVCENGADGYMYYMP